jgi:hypothetical protein
MHESSEPLGLRGATILSLHREAAQRTQHGKGFADDIVDDLRREELLGHVLWSTGCRVADVDAATFAGLVRAGLFLVRLDLEPIRREHERAAVSAVQTLRRLGVLVEYEFGLLGSEARFSSIHDRVRFLRSLVGDGVTPAYLDLPSDGTCSPWLAAYLDRLDPALDPWLCDDGLSSRLGEAWAELVITERLLRGAAGLQLAAHHIALQRLTMRSNTMLLDLVTGSARDFETYGASDRLDPDDIATRCAGLDTSLAGLREALSDDGVHALTG